MKRNSMKLFGMMMGVTALGFVGASTTFADQKNTNVVMSITSSVTLVVPENASILIQPTGTGSFGETYFDVFASTNSDNGYTLTMSTEKTYLEADTVDTGTGEKARINAIPFVTGGITKDAFSASTSSDIINHWGLSIDNTTSYNPISLSKQIKTTDEEATLDPTRINVGVKANTSMVPGVYKNTINFSLVANVVPTEVPEEFLCTENCEDPEDDSTHEDGTGETVVYEGGTLARAYEVYYTETLHKGMYVPTRNTETGEYDGGYKVATSGYDYWGIPASEYRFAMQDMVSEICTNTTVVPSSVRALDTRDNKSYWITKLADGKCWMTQNLDLDLDNRTALTPDDTDVLSNWVPDNSTQKDYVDHWDYSYTSPQSFDPGNYYWNNATYYEPDTYNYLNGDYGMNPVKFSKTPFSSNGEHGHVGNYYSWSAAVAMNNTDAYSLNGYTSSDPDIASKMPQTSICPKGWRLPNAMYKEAGFRNDFRSLLEAYYPNGGNQTDTDFVQTSAPIYYTRSGYVNDYYSQPYFNYSGRYGGYWSNTSSSSSSSYTNEFGGSSYWAFAISNYRYKGFNVRCIAR